MTGPGRPGNELPADIRTDIAHPARVYDYWLGGKDNFAVDRELAQKMLAVHPPSAQMARENRRFLGRAVSYVAACGVLLIALAFRLRSWGSTRSPRMVHNMA